MATPTFQPQPRPYASRCKTDSNGQDHWQVYLPSERGYAWAELIDFPDDQEFRDQILDPDFLPAWKVMWLEDAYLRFRDRENARKRRGKGKQVEFGSEDDLSTPNSAPSGYGVTMCGRWCGRARRSTPNPN